MERNEIHREIYWPPWARFLCVDMVREPKTGKYHIELHEYPPEWRATMGVYMAARGGRHCDIAQVDLPEEYENIQPGDVRKIIGNNYISIDERAIRKILKAT